MNKHFSQRINWSIHNKRIEHSDFREIGWWECETVRIHWISSHGKGFYWSTWVRWVVFVCGKQFYGKFLLSSCARNWFPPVVECMYLPTPSIWTGFTMNALFIESEQTLYFIIFQILLNFYIIFYIISFKTGAVLSFIHVLSFIRMFNFMHFHLIL